LYRTMNAAASQSALDTYSGNALDEIQFPTVLIIAVIVFGLIFPRCGFKGLECDASGRLSGVKHKQASCLRASSQPCKRTSVNALSVVAGELEPTISLGARYLGSQRLKFDGKGLSISHYWSCQDKLSFILRTRQPNTP